MAILLTHDQCIELDNDGNEPHEVVDPRSNEPFYLLTKSEYEFVKNNIDDIAEQQAIRQFAFLNATRIIKETE